jgi:hypothetical protein
VTKIETDKAAFEKSWQLALTEMGIELSQAFAEAAPVDTGYLKGNITYQVDDDSIIYKMPDYAMYVEFGTPPHVIEAKNAKALHFKDGAIASSLGFSGDDVFLKRVHHPGTAPNPFLRQTLLSKFPQIVENALSRQFR